jgi:hypothetical protein
MKQPGGGRIEFRRDDALYTGTPSTIPGLLAAKQATHHPKTAKTSCFPPSSAWHLGCGVPAWLA